MKEVKDRIVSYFSMPISNTAEQMILAKNPNFKGNIGNAYPLCSKTIGELMIEMTDPESKLKGLFNTIFDTIGLPKDHPIRQFFNFVFDNFPKFADWLLKTFINIFTF